MAAKSPTISQGFEPVSPVDMTRTNGPQRTRSVNFSANINEKDGEGRVTSRSIRTNSSSSNTPSLNATRKARFAEATSVFSPVSGPGEHQVGFADKNAADEAPKPSDVGFGYISDNQPKEQFATMRADTGTSLKSALKTPGTASRLINPLSPTFREEVELEKQEEKTDAEQAKDLKIKTRVRMAKMALRGVNFSCSLIVLAMLSTVLTIFHTTKNLPRRNNLPPWAPNTPLWPQIVVLSIACVSLFFAIVVIFAYCRGGHRRAEKVAVYYTMFAVGWFLLSIVMWLVGATLFQTSKTNGGGKDLWGWSCKDNERKALFEDQIHYDLMCRLQNWSMICCIIEIVVEVIVIAIYMVVFYRFYTKNRLRKRMEARDRARSDLYLAQLRSQSAPNTPGYAPQTPRTPGFPSTSAVTPRTPGFPSMSKAMEAADSSPTQYATTTPQSNYTASPFKLQAPPIKVHHATPQADQHAFETARITASSPPPQDRVMEHVAAAPGEQQYDAVPIPGAYAPHNEKRPRGYPQLASYVSADIDGRLYRRFGYLRNRLLLHKQDEIAELEDELERLDRADAAHQDDWFRLVSRRFDDGEPQELKAYDDLLLREHQIMSIREPSKKAHRGYFNYIWNEKPVAKEEYQFVYREDDFAILGDQDDRWLGYTEVFVSCLPHVVLKYLLTPKEYRDKEGDSRIRYYDNKRTTRLVKMIVVTISSLMLVVPIVVLYLLTVHNASGGVKIGVTVIFVAAFGLTLAVMTHATRHETFAACAAYAAVLVVFLSNRLSAREATSRRAKTGSVESFKGIPFAQPPVGNLRLRPPQRITEAFGTIDATGIPRACPQFYIGFDDSNLPQSAVAALLNSPLFQTASDAGEDCLTLNVQRPEGTTSGSALPVVVWIFGGGFQLGSTQIYDGTSLVARSAKLGHPVLFVAMNYRVGGFGFLAGKELGAESSTNLGLRDQRLALEWVQENIAAFGGDPEKVTIWGESAGSISAFDHTVINGGDNCYQGKPLFRGAIMDSGSVIPAEPVTGASAQQVYDTVVQEAGCSSASDTLDCLRKTDYTTFLNAANSVSGIVSYRSLDLSYLPRPDPSDNFFSQSPERALLSGAFARVPIIVGDQEDEGTLFAIITANITTTDDLISYLASYFPSNPNAKDTVAGLVEYYPDDFGISGSPFNTGILWNLYPQFKRLAAILGDITFTLSRRLYVTGVSTQVPAWSYLSSYLYGLPVLGTLHASDIPYAFGWLGDNVPTVSIQTYYISFINSLDPNTISTSSPLINWPQYSVSSPQLLHFKASSNGLIKDDFRQGAAEYLVKNMELFTNTFWKNAWRTQTFEDLNVEKEVNIRRDIYSTLNKKEDDFISKRAYDDFLELREMFVMNLLLGTEAQATRRKLNEYKEANGLVRHKDEAAAGPKSKIKRTPAISVAGLIEGLKRIVVPEVLPPYDPLEGVPVHKDYFTITDDGMDMDTGYEQYKKDEMLAIEGFDFREALEETLTRAFAGLGVFVQTEKSTTLADQAPKAAAATTTVVGLDDPF
ncbi:hypothetical protein DV738_g3968, partial [Chaetothyriales sp. CBS 135597]